MKLHHSAALAVCFAVVVFSPFTFAGTSPMKGTDALRAADEAWMKVFSAKDVEKSVAFCDEQGAVLAPNAPIAEGRPAIAKSFSGFFALPDLKLTWHADKVEVAQSGELGYTSGTYQMTFTAPGGKAVSDKGKYVTVWKKEADGSWKVVLDIFNTDMPEPGAS
jgi:ketosteroid isomerase-like protein